MLNVFEPLQKTIEATMFYDKRRVEVVCPVCGGSGHDFEILDVMRKPIADTHLCICKKCGFITYNQQLKDLNKYYTKCPRPQSIEFLNTKAVKVEKHKKMIGKYLSDKNIKPQNVLDYGSSDGYFLKYLREAIDTPVKVTGIELNPGHANYGKYVDNIDISMDDDLTRFADGEFDLVSCYHVLEHVQQPNLLLQQFNRIIGEKGLLYIGLPTLDRLDYPTIEVLFKEDHINWWTAKSLTQFLNLNGFNVVYENKNLYGTAFICQKAKPISIFQNLYPENIELLKNIHQFYQAKSEMEQFMAQGNVGMAKQAAVRALQQKIDAPEMIVKYASLNDPIDEQDILAGYIKEKPYIWELYIALGMSYIKDQDLEKAEDI